MPEKTTERRRKEAIQETEEEKHVKEEYRIAFFEKVKDIALFSREEIEEKLKRFGRNPNVARSISLILGADRVENIRAFHSNDKTNPLIPLESFLAEAMGFDVQLDEAKFSVDNVSFYVIPERRASHGTTPQGKLKREWILMSLTNMDGFAPCRYPRLKPWHFIPISIAA